MTGLASVSHGFRPTLGSEPLRNPQKAEFVMFYEGRNFSLNAPRRSYPTTYQQVPRFTDGIIEPSLSFTVLETVTLRPSRGAATEAKRVAVRVMSILEKLLPAPLR